MQPTPFLERLTRQPQRSSHYNDDDKLISDLTLQISCLASTSLPSLYTSLHSLRFFLSVFFRVPFPYKLSILS